MIKLKDLILTEASSKVKRQIKNIMKYDHIDDLADYIEKFKIDKKHWRVISHYFDDIRDETMGIKPSGYADRSRKELEKILFKVIKEAKARDYKAEYKKFQSSKKAKKIREGTINEISSSEAKTLLKQLGGNRFMAMTGAKDFGIGNDGLHFKIGRNYKSISHIAIDYNRGKDIYDMKFL